MAVMLWGREADWYWWCSFPEKQGQIQFHSVTNKSHLKVSALDRVWALGWFGSFFQTCELLEWRNSQLGREVPVTTIISTDAAAPLPTLDQRCCLNEIFLISLPSYLLMCELTSGCPPGEFSVWRDPAADPRPQDSRALLSHRALLRWPHTVELPGSPLGGAGDQVLETFLERPLVLQTGRDWPFYSATDVCV